MPDQRTEALPNASHRCRRAVLFALALLLGNGCALRGGTPLLRMTWPEPPLPARIEFVSAVASERDVTRGFDLSRLLSVGLIGLERKVWHLYQPVGVAVSDDGERAYVADYSQALLYVFDFAHGSVRVVGEEGGFGRPIGLAVDGDGQIYVSDQKTKAVQVLSVDGTPVRTLHLDHIERPEGIAIDRARGRLYVADAGGLQSSEHYVRIYDLEGRHVGNIGQGRGGGPGELYFPTYVALDAAGQLYVSDTMNSRVAVFDAEGKFVRQVGKQGDSFGEFDKPKGLALDTFGNLYVADSSWSIVQIFNPRGEVLLFFGGRSRYPGMFENPTGIAIDRQNRIYVCDTFNHRLSMYRLVNTTAGDSFVTLPLADEKGGGPGA